MSGRPIPPGAAMALYLIDWHLPFVVSAVLLVGLVAWGRHSLPRRA